VVTVSQGHDRHARQRLDCDLRAERGGGGGDAEADDSQVGDYLMARRSRSMRFEPEGSGQRLARQARRHGRGRRGRRVVAGIGGVSGNSVAISGENNTSPRSVRNGVSKVARVAAQVPSP
jgi:hypothetical protein